MIFLTSTGLAPLGRERRGLRLTSWGRRLTLGMMPTDAKGVRVPGPPPWDLPSRMPIAKVTILATTARARP